MSDDTDIYDEIARAVGDVCLHWVTIEDVINDLISHLAVYIHSDFENPATGDILHITLSQMDVRQKIATSKVLAHHINTPDSPNFYDQTASLLNYLDNTVRPERNRYVHDYWSVEGEEIIRAKFGAKVHRPQSRQRILSMWSERRYKNLDAAQAFIENLGLAYEDLVELDNHIAWLMSRRDSLSTHQQPLPPEWRSLTHHDWRDPSTL